MLNPSLRRNGTRNGTLTGIIIGGIPNVILSETRNGKLSGNINDWHSQLKAAMEAAMGRSAIPNASFLLG